MNEQWLNLYRIEIEDFYKKTREFAAGELSRKDYKGISGGFGSYAQRDGTKHMLRLRMPGGRLTGTRLQFLARIASKYDVAPLKLTTCETIQLHNLTPDLLPVVMEHAAYSDIITRGGGGDNPRNVMASPLTGVQTGEAFDVMPWAEAASDYLLSICRDIHMPRKLKVAFCNGVDDCVHARFRDMGFIAQPDGTFRLFIAGGLGNNHRMGVQVVENLPATDVLYAIRAMIDVFCAHGNYENRAKARTRYLQETLGAEELCRVYREALDARKAEGGLDLNLTPKAVTKTGSGSLENARVIVQKQPGLYAVAYHPIGGILPTGKPTELATLLRDMPAAECRVAPHETIYIINLTADEAARILAATEDGAQTVFETSVACIGASICQQGVRDSQAALQACVKAVREAGIPDGALPKICISGCPSSCSAHQAAAIGFQGGVKPVPGSTPAPAFRMFLNGNDALGAEKFGDLQGVVYESDLPAMLVELGQAAAAAGENWESWHTTHADEMKTILAKYL